LFAGNKMALDIAISQVGQAMDNVEEAVRAVRVRLAIEEVLELSSAASVSRTGLLRCAQHAPKNIFLLRLLLQASLEGCSWKRSSPPAATQLPQVVGRAGERVQATRKAMHSSGE
jgi:hypothetical protein